MRVRAVGLNATIDLYDHHLIIHRSGDMFSGGPTELMVPLNSIKSVQFRRPSGWRSGRIIIALDGAAAPKRGGYNQKVDPTSVTFSGHHLPAFEQVVEVIREAIATPSIEQMAMGAQRDRQERVPQVRPQTEPTRAVLERIDPPGQSYNPNTGADYGATGDAGHYRYHHPGEHHADAPPLNPEMPIFGKVVLIAIPLILLLVMCSGPGEDRASNLVEQVTDATEAAPADVQDLSDNNIEAMPPLGQLLLDGDSRGCSHPDTLQVIRNIILPSTLSPGAFGLSAREMQVAVANASTAVTDISVTDMRNDIHELSCTGKLRYATGATSEILITYKVRPAANKSGDVIVWLDGMPDLTWLVMSEPMRNIQAQHQPPSPPPQEAGPVQQPSQPALKNDPEDDRLARDLVHGLRNERTRASPNDDDLYAPHVN